MYAAPKPIAPGVCDEVGGGSTPKAKAYIWPKPGKTPVQRGDDAPPRSATLTRAQPAPPAKITVTRADGTPYEFSASSGDEIDPIIQKVVRLPTKLMSPYRAVGSVKPVSR